MALEHHLDSKLRFTQQVENSQAYVLAFINETKTIQAGLKVLEIGCGEAGVLQAFTQLGHRAVGIELEESRTELARQFMAAELAAGQVRFLNKDVYDVDVEKDIGNQFDLVILKDVIEHIPKQELFIPQLHKFLKPGGMVFYAFPPWQMPYGGHQQILPGKLASRMPYYHLLPGFLYPLALKVFGVNASGVNTMLDIKSTGISIERFLKINKKSDLFFSRICYNNKRYL